MMKINIRDLDKYIGKLIVVDNHEYKWMFKLLNYNKLLNQATITQPIDILPKPRFYDYSTCRDAENFNKITKEPIADFYSYGLPTKEDLNLYRKYTREARLLGTNNSHYGTK